MWESMAEPPARFSIEQRATVLGSLVETCLHRDWRLLAAHVRSDHVHAVVVAPCRPELVMHDLKSYATRVLKQGNGRQRWWSRHGSTKYLWNAISVEAAIHYVLEAQGEPMAVYPHGTAPVMARP